MEKTVNHKAWFLVLPVLVLVAFSAVIPLMTVVNYSVQDTFGNNQFFWAGLEWFEEMLHSERMWDALGRQLKDGGRLVAINGGKAVTYIRAGDQLQARRLFDAAAPVAPGFARAPEFAL